MKKILLATVSSIGAITLLASVANAQTTPPTATEQKPGLKISVGGKVGAVIMGSRDSGTDIALPSWRNFLKIQADGQIANWGVTYGAFLRYRPFDGAKGADKVYVYLGQKYFGTVTVGRDSSVLSKTLISPTELVPGFSMDGDALAAGGNYGSVYNITQSAKPTVVSYITPTVYGVKLGYSYAMRGQASSPGKAFAKDFLDQPLGATHDFFARYDGAFGPVSLAVQAGGRVGQNFNATQRVTAVTAGAQVGYTDGKNIGLSVNGNYSHATNGPQYANGWGIGLGLNTPRVAGLSFGALFGSADKTGIKNYHVGVGLGYAWSENFTQTIGYDRAFGGNAGNNGWSWVLANQVSF